MSDSGRSRGSARRRPERDPRRLGPFETLGAWLRIWTPPRGVEPPPVPWRRIAVGAIVLSLVLGAAAVVVVPAIDRGKREHSAREKRDAARRQEARARRLAEEGRLRRGSARPPAGLSRLSPARQREARTTLVRSLEAAVTRDARGRVRRGELEGPVLGARCTIEPPSQRFIERDLSRRAGAYDCLAITRRGEGGRFLVGDFFRGRVDYRRFTYTWRKVCLPPGEGAARLAC
jgi:hypothetical protein